MSELRYAYDLHPRTDPKNGARIVRFTKLIGGEWEAEANGTGSGFLVLPADASEADSIDPLGLQYVRVIEIDEAVVDGATLSGFAERVVFGFFLENGDFKALDEKNSKKLTFGGAGTLSYLQRAIIAEQTYIAGAEGPYDDTWHWFYSTPGAILERMVVEAQEPTRPQAPIPDVTPTFDVLTDSDGNPWGSLWDSWLFEARVGDNLLQLMKRLMEHNLYVEMDPDTWELNAWDADTHRRDRTGASWGASVIRFQAPTDGTLATGNILADATRGIAAFIKRSDMLVGDKGIYSWVAGAADIDWEGYYPNADETEASHDGTGQAQLTARADAANTVRLRGIIGKSPANGQYRPLHVDGVLLDDLATLHTGTGQWDFNEDAFPVAAVGAQLRTGGDWDIFYDLGSSYTSMAERAFQARGVGTHTHPPNPQLCRDTVGSLIETFTRTEASGLGPTEFTGHAEWEADPTETATLSVNGSAAVATGAGGGIPTVAMTTTLPVELLLRFRWRGAAAIGQTAGIGILQSTGGQEFLQAQRRAADTRLILSGDSGIDTTDGLPIITPDEWMLMRILIEAGEVNGTLWIDGDIEPSPQVTVVGAPSLATYDLIQMELFAAAGQTSEADTITIVQGAVAASTCIHGGPAATSGNASETCGKCVAAGNHEHDYVAAGGIVGQVLKKASATDWDTGWEDESGGSPTDATYLVTTAHADLSAEVVVGATPGGELGGTWASPTVDATHSGSAHHTENHATRHADGGADEVAVEGLPTAETDTALVLHPNGTGGIVWGTDEGGGSGIAGELVTDTIIGDGVAATFALSETPTGAWALVSTNGADLLPTEYAIVAGDIVFDVAPVNLAEVLVTFITGGFTVPATDPSDIVDPTIATAEDVALKLNALMANLRTAGIIA